MGVPLMVVALIMASIWEASVDDIGGNWNGCVRLIYGRVPNAVGARTAAGDSAPCVYWLCDSLSVRFRGSSIYLSWRLVCYNVVGSGGGIRHCLKVLWGATDAACGKENRDGYSGRYVLSHQLTRNTWFLTVV